MTRCSIIGILWLLTTRIAFAGLPWEVIVDQYDKGVLLFEKTEGLSNYSLSKGLDDVSNKSGQVDLTSSRLSVYQWSNKQWKILMTGTVSEWGHSLNPQDEIVYKCVLDEIEDDPNSGMAYYILISSNWKKELFTHCQKLKQVIESQSQIHTISASIMRSHFDNLQEKIVNSPYLTEDILARMSLALKSKEQYERGHIPAFAKGLNKLRFKRFEGADYTDIVIKVPDNYDPALKWPVYVVMDPAQWLVNKYGREGKHSSKANFHPGMIDMWWHSIPSHGEALYRDLKWKEFLYVKAIMEKHLNIDTDRYYLFGECWNGMSAMAVTVNYPDTWAHCMIQGGNSYRYLIGNASNTAVKYSTDHPNIPERLADCSFCSKCFEYSKCINYSYIASGVRDLFNDNRNEVAVHSPRDIQLTIERLNNPRAYWLTILGREDENYVATIKVSVDGQNIRIIRRNVDAYELDLKTAPIDHNRPAVIIDNGISNAIAPAACYTYRSDKYNEAQIVKNAHLHGPINDVFTDAYTVVYTVGKNEKQTEKIVLLAKMIAGTGPCVSEQEVSESMIENHNIVIVGKADNCQILHRIADQLPVRFGVDEITYDGQKTNGDWGAVMICPNPLNPKKYIAFVLAGSDSVLNNLSDIWTDKVSRAKVDVAIFKLNSEGYCNFLRSEKFDTTWNWHKSWNEPLAAVSKEHPRWRWRQWVGYVIRKQLDADVMISEGKIQRSEIPNHECITLRDLNESFEDEWIVKIQLKGHELKALLMQSMAGTESMANRKGHNKPPEYAKNPVVSGITFVKALAIEGSDIHVSQIDPNRYYTVALPEKLVNGSRLGMILKDYEIVGDGYVLPMIQNYLEQRKPLQLDSELEKMKLTFL